MLVSIFILCHLLFILGLGEYIPSGVNDLLYPTDSLKNPGSLYSLGGKVPESRIHSSMAIGPHPTDQYIIVYGGYSYDGSLLDDLNLYDTRAQQWSGVMLRLACCDDSGKIVNLMSSDVYMPESNPPNTRPVFEGNFVFPLKKFFLRVVYIYLF